MSGNRGLTSGEVDMINDFFNGTINTNEISVQKGFGIGIVGLNNNIVGYTPNLTIKLRDDFYSDDFSLEDDLGLRSNFIHELVHTLQNQLKGQYYTGRTALGLSLDYLLGNTYNYTLGKNWEDYNIEQQAKIIEDYYISVQTGNPNQQLRSLIPDSFIHGFKLPSDVPVPSPNPLSDNWDADTGDSTGDQTDDDADDSEAPSGGLTKPVIIDLSAGAAADQSSDGLDFYGLYNSPVFFNSDEDAFRERTAWVGPNEGIVTHVSTAKDGATLFEIALTKAVKSQYGIEASTDMEALYLGFDKGVDANKDGTITLSEGKGDGKIAAAEAESLGLKIWRDADMDGVVDAGEMVSFAEAGIDFIDLNDTNVDELKKAQDGSGAEADDIIEARFGDGSVIFGTATVQLSNGAKTTAYDMGLAHEKLGMIEYEDAAGFVNKVRLERGAGVAAQDWQYREAASGSAAVNWDFDQAANAATYGATGSEFSDTMVYSGTSRRSFSGGGGHFELKGGRGFRRDEERRQRAA